MDVAVEQCGAEVTSPNTPESRVRPAAWAGIGLVLGSGLGVVIGSILGGGVGIALGVAFGGGFGLVVGSAIDAHRRKAPRPKGRP